MTTPPYLGQMVHYVEAGNIERAAIISAELILDDDESDTNDRYPVTLDVSDPGGNSYVIEFTEYSAKPISGTWHDIDACPRDYKKFPVSSEDLAGKA